MAEPERMLGQYLLWHEAEGHSRKTELVYQQTLRPFFTYLASEHHLTDLTDLAALTLNELRAWLVWLRNTPGPHGRPRSSKTIESYCRQVKAFTRWCADEGLLERDPAERLRLPKQKRSTCASSLTRRSRGCMKPCMPPQNGLRPEVRRMLTARNRAILWMLLDTGIRAEELCRIRFADLDRRRRTVYIMGKGA
jgi:site-specific recombinase XerD